MVFKYLNLLKRYMYLVIRFLLTICVYLQS